MTLNNCSPDNVYGPIEHTLFLGCSVTNFTCTAGFSEQTTEVTVQLVEDTCPARPGFPKIYYDTQLNRQEWTQADPGFMGEELPIIGCPAYFRMGDFEFCGLIQSWEKENSSNVLGGIVVKLVTPVKVLQNTQLIIGEYAGPVKDSSTLFGEAIANLINVYGFAESIDGFACPLVSQTSPGVYNLGDSGVDGAVFGTSAGGFGGANVNDNGMEWFRMLNMINVLTSALPANSNNFSPHGRLVHKGVSIGLYGSPWTNGFGLLDFDSIVNARYVSEYYLDLSELPIPPQYFRFSGVTVNLLEAVTRVCQECGYEYYIEMVPIKSPSLSSSGVGKLIKIRGLSKLIQPNFGGIDDFISTAETDGKLEASSIGRELRDDTTSTFLIGGPKQTIYQAFQTTDPEGDGDPTFPEDDDMILPYFGTDISGNMLVPYLASGNLWEFEADTTEINLALQELQLINPLIINEKELQFSTSIEIWKPHIRLYQTDSYRSISGELPEAGIDSNRLADIIENSPVANLASRDLAHWNMAYADITNLVYKRRIADEEKIYQWISNFANEFYGKKFSVRVPYSCASINTESLIVNYSEQPTNDGGWTEEPTVIGLPNGTYFTDYFTNEQNKIGCFTRFNGASGYDLSQLSKQDYVVYNEDLYIRSDVEEQYVFHDRLNQTYPRIVVSLPAVIQESEESEDTTFARIHAAKQNFDEWLDSAWIPDSSKPSNKVEAARLFASLYENISAQHIYEEYGRLVYYPDAVAVPMRSNVNTYGPWISIGPAGGMRVEKNDGLVPWQFGNYSILNTAAQALADAGNTNMQVGELGSVTVAGYPEVPIGAEINSLAALAGQQLVENRSPLFDNFNGTFVGGAPFTFQYLKYNYGFTMEGAFGPSVGNISISVGDKITTTYNMRSYTPEFGRFAQINSQRLSQIGQQRMAYNRDVRAFLYQREAIRNKKSLSSNGRETFNSIKSQAQAIRKVHQGQTPHELLIGQNLAWTTGVSGNPQTLRSIIATESIRDAIAEMSSGSYPQKAFMSWDGLFSPVSMGGDGGLPRYVVSAGGSGNTLVSYVGDTSGNIVRTITGSSSSLDASDFNLLSNPAGYQFSELASRHTGTMGHNVDIVARGSGIPSGGMILRHGPSGNGLGYDYRNDYRFMTWRGPIWIHQWGYDTQGKPIPNQSDIEANTRSGIFNGTGLSDNFMSDWLQKPDTWPLGPLAVTFNRATRCWEAQSSISKMNGKILGHLGPHNGVLVQIVDSGTNLTGVSGTVTGYAYQSGYANPYTNNLYASGCILEFQLNSERARWEVNNSSELAILITGTVSGATWNSSLSGLVPTKFSAPAFIPYYATGVSGSGPFNTSGILQYRTGLMVTGWNRYTETISVSAGGAVIGKLRNGWLEGAECNSVTL